MPIKKNRRRSCQGIEDDLGPPGHSSTTAEEFKDVSFIGSGAKTSRWTAAAPTKSVPKTHHWCVRPRSKTWGSCRGVHFEAKTKWFEAKPVVPVFFFSENKMAWNPFINLVRSVCFGHSVSSSMLLVSPMIQTNQHLTCFFFLFLEMPNNPSQRKKTIHNTQLSFSSAIHNTSLDFVSKCPALPSSQFLTHDHDSSILKEASKHREKRPSAWNFAVLSNQLPFLSPNKNTSTKKDVQQKKTSRKVRFFHRNM